MPGKEDGTEGELDHTAEGTIIDLKIKKTRQKTRYTRAINRLKNCIFDKTVSVDETKVLGKGLLDKVEEEMDEAIDSLNTLCLEYKNQEKTKEMNSTMKEIEIIEDTYNETVKEYHAIVNIKDFSDDEASELKDHKESDIVKEKQLDKDMKSQMKRVQIPVFSGAKKDYPFWKAAFTSCVDKTDSSGEYKFLQMRQYLKGEALEAIEGLGHTTVAYEKAKERLDRKYGGPRRLVNKFLEEISSFPIIKFENPKAVEKFADLLDIAIVNIQEHEMEDMQSGYMYQQLLKKLPEAMIIRYQRYMFDNKLKESVSELSKWINRESEFMTIAHEARHGLDEKNEREHPYRYNKDYSKQHKQERQRTFFQGVNAVMLKKKRNCGYCNTDGHETYQCASFKALSVKQRWEEAKRRNMCFRCLRNNHRGGECFNYRVCNINNCHKTHDRLLHNEDPNKSHEDESQTNEATSGPRDIRKNQESGFLSTEKGYVALRTLPVVLKANGRKVQVNALLDDGSTRTYLNESVAAQLGLWEKLETVQINTLNGQCEAFETMPVKFHLESGNGVVRTEIEANTMKNVTGTLQTIDWNREKHKFEHLRGIEFPVVGKHTKIDLLIGVDYIDLHQSLHEIKGQPGEPVARLTPLGWTCVGVTDKTHYSNYSYFVSSEKEDLNKTLKQFWEVESVTSKDNELSVINQKVLKSSKEGMTYENERYEVKLPWIKNKMLPEQNNYETALRRLKSTERKLHKHPEVKEQYENVIKSYIEKGYISEVKCDKPENEIGWYLPHFPIIRPDKETTKIRIVFDASAKLNGMSLNDAIHEGPKLQNELTDVLLRFRKQPIALMCDISEMYLQIGIIESDRPFLRFLWKSDNSSPSVYQFKRLVFGLNASPFLAQLVSQSNAQKFESQYTRAAESVIKSTYMDDTMDSVANEDEAIALYEDLHVIWKKAGMTARKWLSNSQKVLESIPQEERSLRIDLKAQELPTVKTLGVQWDAKKDVFMFHVAGYTKTESLTKREVLRRVAKLYDPIGLVSPYIVVGKILMQKLWLAGYDWDDKIDSETQNEVEKWLNSIHELEKVTVPRHLEFSEENQLTTVHVFVDASEKAYGTVAYVRHVNKEGIKIAFVSSKTRVTPLSSYSIPRLELLAAILGLRMTLNILTPLEVPMTAVTFWTDSANVLWWIYSQSKNYKCFVGNRIGEIHEQTTPVQWRHVPSNMNPADIASRGANAESLVKNDIWWNGPEFLKDQEEYWPVNTVTKSGPNPLDLKKSVSSEEQSTMFVNSKSKTFEKRLDAERHSDWMRLVRIQAWVYRFVNNCRYRSNRKSSQVLTRDEIVEAETVIIRRDQEKHFSKEYYCLENGQAILPSSSLMKLNVKIDEHGVLRCDTRLTYAKFLPYETKYPILLARKSAVTKLIVKYHHELVNHHGTNQTLTSLSVRFWIVAAREEIRDWENSCSVCRKNKVGAANQIMAPLPRGRVAQSMRAFTHCSVDFAGPFFTKQGRGKTRQKRYLCVFTCLETRAVHLEIAFSLNTDSFMNALYRMIARRGYPKEMYSDNGSNFIGANRELRELWEKIDKDKLKANGANRGMQWHFNPPLAPHFGGIHESMVKSAKRAICTVLKNGDVTDEELFTVFAGAEGLINSRPLTYQTSNPKDDTVLTPNHFLHGQTGGVFAPESIDTTSFDIRKRWRFVQEIVRHFWQRWLREFLTVLGGRKKWHQQRRNMQVNDVVLVIEPEKPRGQWSLGRVIEVFPGTDGNVRVVNVQVGKSIYKRPITRLCLLEES